jgi:formate--tetrahydrofolate ligase
MYDYIVPIRAIADKLKIPEELLDYYGKYTAKIKLEAFSHFNNARPGKLILVTAMTPTNQGEGKTVVSIGLAQAIERLGKSAIVTLREPSLGPVFGSKGGATGGGKAQVLPSEKINLHFNGDFPAITAAHNLLAAMLDAHIHHGNELNIDVDNIFWPRALDINDRALRQVIIGLGGKQNGVPRESGFIITAASEITAILALANSRQDLREKLGSIVIGQNRRGKVIRARDLKATGAMMALLNEAIMPNLAQTSEQTAALVHTGPFANIAHGTSSLISQKMALKLADYVINETGFGADLGLEKYLDIVMPASGLKPSAAVLVVTVKGLIAQGAQTDKEIVSNDSIAILKRGFNNLIKHAEIIKKFHLPFVVAINRFSNDSDSELSTIKDLCQQASIDCEVVEIFQQGGAGAIDLAAKVIKLADGVNLDEINSLYAPKLSLIEKIEIIAKEIYGADGIYLETKARKKLKKFTELGFNSLPICIAKTPLSLADNPQLIGVPKDWTLVVTDANLAAGAGFIVAIAGNMLLMPGLPKIPRAISIDVDDSGNIISAGRPIF